MKLEEFEIGKTFFASAGFEWLCTDKGSRVITAIMLDEQKSEIWFKGPPYALEEEVFDEHAMKSCYCTTSNLLLDRIERLEDSSHPNFSIDDVVLMMKEKDRKYPRKKLLTIDRVTNEGHIYHPYAAKKKNNEWFIKVFELFSRQYTEIHEDEFIKLEYCTEQALRKRKESYNQEVK